MKKLLLCSAAVIGMCGIASAADLRMPVKAPPPVIAPAFSWTGCYVGGFVGGAWTANDAAAYDLDSYNGGPFGRGWAYKADSSFIGGGQVGCNWQPVGSQFVLGIEGEVGYMNINGAAADPFNGFADTVASVKVGDWYGMITGRLGWSFDRALLYVKGGAAFVNVETSIFDGTIPGALLINASTSETKATWTVGGGLEYALDMNWSLKAEYMYIASDYTATTCGVATNALTYCWDHDVPGIHTAKVGFNYRFGGAAPVVARY